MATGRSSSWPELPEWERTLHPQMPVPRSVFSSGLPAISGYRQTNPCWDSPSPRGGRGCPSSGRGHGPGPKICWPTSCGTVRGAGVVLIASGERELLASHVMAGIPNRLYFPKGASSESMMAWPKLPALIGLPGRALATGPLADDAVESLGDAVDASGEAAGPAVNSGSHVAQLLHLPRGALSAKIASSVATSPPRPAAALHGPFTAGFVSATDVLSAVTKENPAGQQETARRHSESVAAGFGRGWLGRRERPGQPRLSPAGHRHAAVRENLIA